MTMSALHFWRTAMRHDKSSRAHLRLAVAPALLAGAAPAAAAAAPPALAASQPRRLEIDFNRLWQDQVRPGMPGPGVRFAHLQDPAPRTEENDSWQLLLLRYEDGRGRRFA